MAYLESDMFHVDRFGKKVEIMYLEILLKSRLRLISLTYVKHVLRHIFLYSIPRTAAEAQSVALTYGVEP